MKIWKENNVKNEKLRNFELLSFCHFFDILVKKCINFGQKIPCFGQKNRGLFKGAAVAPQMEPDWCLLPQRTQRGPAKALGRWSEQNRGAPLGCGRPRLSLVFRVHGPAASLRSANGSPWIPCQGAQRRLLCTHPRFSAVYGSDFKS